jgi:hypothetical protein
VRAYTVVEDDFHGMIRTNTIIHFPMPVNMTMQWKQPEQVFKYPLIPFPLHFSSILLDHVARNFCIFN